MGEASVTDGLEGNSASRPRRSVPPCSTRHARARVALWPRTQRREEPHSLWVGLQAPLFPPESRQLGPRTQGEPRCHPPLLVIGGGRQRGERPPSWGVQDGRSGCGAVPAPGPALRGTAWTPGPPSGKFREGLPQLPCLPLPPQIEELWAAPERGCEPAAGRGGGLAVLGDLGVLPHVGQAGGSGQLRAPRQGGAGPGTRVPLGSPPRTCPRTWAAPACPGGRPWMASGWAGAVRSSGAAAPLGSRCLGPQPPGAGQPTTVGVCSLPLTPALPRKGLGNAGRAPGPLEARAAGPGSPAVNSQFHSFCYLAHTLSRR